MKTLKTLLFVLPFLCFACKSDEEGVLYDSGLVANNNGTYNDESYYPTSGDQYHQEEENAFVDVSQEAVSTFSIDADGASYTNIRRYLNDNTMPPTAAVRTEEMINFFDLDYQHTQTEHPISINGEVSECPWKEGNKLVRIGIKGAPMTVRPTSNFIFLIDVSGSMSSSDKLPMLKKGFNMVVDELGANDRIAIVTYAGSQRVVLQSTSASEKQRIKSAINSLGSGGGTAGAQGIVTAYEIAQQNFIQGGNNRVIVGTDGDFNIGISNRDDLVSLIEEKRKSGVFLTALGVGRGNLNDAMLEQLANHGNGTYEYIDREEQLKNIFIDNFGKLFTVAKDVKVQVKFDANHVKSYRLIGYENRVLNNQDFNDDTKDAGEIGAGQNITALYEIIPQNSEFSGNASACVIDFRYKDPDNEHSKLLSTTILDEGNSFSSSSDFMQFTASIASFSLLLRKSQYKGTSNYGSIIEWLNNTSLLDPNNHKHELKILVQKAQQLDQ